MAKPPRAAIPLVSCFLGGGGGHGRRAYAATAYCGQPQHPTPLSASHSTHRKTFRPKFELPPFPTELHSPQGSTPPFSHAFCGLKETQVPGGQAFRRARPWCKTQVAIFPFAPPPPLDPGGISGRGKPPQTSLQPGLPLPSGPRPMGNGLIQAFFSCRNTSQHSPLYFPSQKEPTFWE